MSGDSDARRRFEARTWWTPGYLQALERVTDRLLDRFGLEKVEFEAFEEGNGLRMTGGSQLGVTAFGGRFASPKRVPKEVRLWTTWDGEGPRLYAEVRDTLDAERVRSPHLIRCYWQITREIFDAIEAVI